MSEERIKQAIKELWVVSKDLADDEYSEFLENLIEDAEDRLRALHDSWKPTP